MKKLVIEKMEKDLMPNLSENIIEDFYLTPDYFEKDLNTKYGSGFSIQPKFTQSAYFRFHNKSEYMMVFTLLEQEHTLVQVCQVYCLLQRY